MRKRYLWLLTCMLFAVALVSGATTQKKGTTASGSQDPSLGRWTLSHKSRFVAKEDRLISMTRSYQRDGDKVKVTWHGTMANGKTSSGSYSAKCDGTPEK